MSNLWDSKDLIGITGAPSEYIGKRFAYSRREAKIRFDWLLPTLIELGLEKYAPKQPTPADAFRRAFADIDSGTIKDNNKRYKITMIRINESDNPIIRNIQVTEVDRQNKSTTDGRLVAQIKYDRHTEEITALYGREAECHFMDCPEFVEQRIEEAKDKYIDERYLVSNQPVSDMIRRILEGCGITVKNIPSTWTIPATREDTLNALVELSERMNSEIEEGIFNIDTIPVVSTKETKKKLSIDAVAYAFDRLNRILKQEQEAVISASDIDKQKIRSMSRFSEEAEGVLEIVKEYELLLGEALDEVNQIKAITQNKLNEFCEDANKRAEYKAAKNPGKPKRKMRKEEDAAPFIDSEETLERKPVRKINAVEVNQASIFC